MTLDAPGGAVATFRDLTLVRGYKHVRDDDATKELLRKLLVRLGQVTPEHEVFRQWCDYIDPLVYPDMRDKFGPDLWPDHESAKINGRQHVSGGVMTPYFEVPSALQAVTPIENILATEETPEGRKKASALERVYSAWKREEDFELKWHKAITTKSIYGRTAARIYWDEQEKRPCFEVIQQPRHLFLGYKTDSFEDLEWAAYRTYWEPNALIEEFGVEVVPVRQDDGSSIPLVTQRTWDENPGRPYVQMGDAQIEVWDYWYRQPVWKGQKFIRMDTYNVVIAGNLVVRGPLKYPEYEGKLPYIPLYNSFVPGLPGGRSDLYDVAPLLMEELERITSGSQMIANGTSGDAFQLVGPDAPTRVPAGLKPVKNGVIAPGPGNRIEVITPFIAQFQLEQHLGRIDRKKAEVTGLNDLLLGLAPAQVLSSSKAINALISNFEARLSIRRRMLYKFRRLSWEMALTIMKKKMTGEMGEAIRAMEGFLDIKDPSLSPRDDMETATRALNLMNGKLMSQRTAMDLIGIEDPETEQDLIREERTDATMFPAEVQVMAQLLGALQALGLQAPAAQGIAEQQLGRGQNDLRNSLGAATPDSTNASQGEGAQGINPGIPGAAPEAGGTPGSFAAPPDNQPVMQGMVQGGEAKGRIMTQQKLGRR